MQELIMVSDLELLAANEERQKQLRVSYGLVKQSLVERIKRHDILDETTDTSAFWDQWQLQLELLQSYVEEYRVTQTMERELKAKVYRDQPRIDRLIISHLKKGTYNGKYKPT